MKNCSPASASAPSRCCPSRRAPSSPEANFGDDLDADSLDLVELVMALEEEFDISVPEEELEGVETVQNAYDLVAGKALMTGGRGSPSPASASSLPPASGPSTSGPVSSARQRSEGAPP